MSVQLLSSRPGGTLLPAIRGMLQESDEALLCVAFVNRKGVALLEPELRWLGPRCRLVATTAFGQSTEKAFTRLHSCGTVVRVLNPAAGTYHPKLLLARSGRRRTIMVGSANLTSRLLCNIEVGALLCDEDSSSPTAQTGAAWELGEALWAHPDSRPWDPAEPLPPETLDPTLLDMIRAAVPAGSTIETIAAARLNEIVDVNESGVYVSTNRSATHGSGPQLIEAWMLDLAWQMLTRNGHLTNVELLQDAHVHRSSAVCAILARLPGVAVTSTRPIRLAWLHH